MHLKILIGLVTLGLIAVDAKGDAKASAQDYSYGPFRYFPSVRNGLAGHFAGQQFAGAEPVPYNARFVFGSNIGYAVANSIAGNLLVNPQASYNTGTNYAQSIPVPVSYASSGAPQDYYGFRLWPKHLVNPNGAPSPPISAPDPIYNLVSSTPSPPTNPSSNKNDKPEFAPDSQYSSTPSPIQVQYPQFSAGPVALDSRSAFLQSLFRLNSPIQQLSPNSPVFSFAGSPYQINYQQPAISPNTQNQASHPLFLINHQQQIAAQTANNQQPIASPYTLQNQRLAASPAPYLFNYQQPQSIIPQLVFQNQPTPVAPNAYPTQQPTLPPYYIGNNRQPPAASYSFNSQQSAPTSAPYLLNYQQPVAAPYSINQQQVLSYYNTGNYPLPIAFSNGFYQPSSPSPPLMQYQQPKGVSNVLYQSTPAPLENYQQHIPESAAASSPNQIQIDRIKLSDSVDSKTSYSSSAAKTHSITFDTSSTPVVTIAGVTENIKAATPTPVTLRPEIIKTDYSGSVSPQYNHIVSSTPSSIRFSFGSDPFYANLVEQPSYDPLRIFAGYSSPSIDVSTVRYDGLGKK